MNFKDRGRQIAWNWPIPRRLTGERAQPHEELSLQEGAVRKIRIEGIQEVEELKRAQEITSRRILSTKIER